MKKIFTLALATLAVAGMSAAPKAAVKPMNFAKYTIAGKVEAKGIQTPEKVKYSSRSIDRDIVPGNYNSIFFARTSEGLSQFSFQDPVVVAQNGTDYTITIPFYPEIGPAAMTVTPEEPSLFSVAVGETVADEVVLETQNGPVTITDLYYSVGAYTPADGQVYEATTPKCYLFNNNGTDLMMLNFNWNGLDDAETILMLIGNVDGEELLIDFIASANFFIPNGTFEGNLEIDGKSQALEGECYGLTWTHEQYGDMIEVYGLCEMAGPVDMIVDEAKGTVSMPACFATYMYSTPCFFGNAADPEAFIEGTYEKKDDGTITVTLSKFDLCTNDGTVIGVNNDVKFSFNEEFMGGINDVAADVDNSNAPVVYYNLQGQRINTPAAGQIVIRKQGTEATKILVK